MLQIWTRWAVQLILRLSTWLVAGKPTPLVVEIVNATGGGNCGFYMFLPDCFKPIPPNFPLYLKCWEQLKWWQVSHESITAPPADWQELSRHQRGFLRRGQEWCQSPVVLDKIQALPAFPALPAPTAPTESSDFLFCRLSHGPNGPSGPSWSQCCWELKIFSQDTIQGGRWRGAGQVILLPSHGGRHSHRHTHAEDGPLGANWVAFMMLCWDDLGCSMEIIHDYPTISITISITISKPVGGHQSSPPPVTSIRKTLREVQKWAWSQT